MATGAGPVDGEWASFVAAPPPVRRVAEDWLAGLARNPAAPAALLVRLLDTDAFLHVLYRPDLPSKVVDVAFWHPSEGVRWHVWETQPLAPGQWNKAVSAMPDWRWRQFMFKRRGTGRTTRRSPRRGTRRSRRPSWTAWPPRRSPRWRPRGATPDARPGRCAARSPRAATWRPGRRKPPNDPAPHARSIRNGEAPARCLTLALKRGDGPTPGPQASRREASECPLTLPRSRPTASAPPSAPR